MRQNELKTTLILTRSQTILTCSYLSSAKWDILLHDCTGTCKYFPCALKVLFNEEIEDSNYIYHPYP